MQHRRIQAVLATKKEQLGLRKQPSCLAAGAVRYVARHVTRHVRHLLPTAKQWATGRLLSKFEENGRF